MQLLTAGVDEAGRGLLTAGVDEAGRGPLAGCVVAAAVILQRPIAGIDDSKKLSARRREQLALVIKQQAHSWALASASVNEIDQINILQASLLAMRRAIEALAQPPRLVLVDGKHSPDVAMPCRSVVKGDSLIPAISAASILAKTHRDSLMLAQHQQYPQYRFDLHKGYPTRLHLQQLQQHGPCPVHRRSFAPVRALVEPQASC